MNLMRLGSSLSMMPLRVSQVGCVTGVPAGGPGCLNPSCTEQHPSGFRCGATTQEAAVNIWVHLFVWTSFSFQWVDAPEHDCGVTWYVCIQCSQGPRLSYEPSSASSPARAVVAVFNFSSSASCVRMLHISCPSESCCPLQLNFSSRPLLTL